MPVFRIATENGEIVAHTSLDDLRLVVEEFWDVLDEEFEFWDAEGRRVRFSSSFLTGNPSGIQATRESSANDLVGRFARYASTRGVELTESERAAPFPSLYQIIVERQVGDRP